MTLTIRAATNADGPALIALVSGAYARYENSFLDVNEEPELLTPADSFDKMWVLETDGGWIAGSFGFNVHDNLTDLKKVYLAPKYWGSGWGSRMYDHAAKHFEGEKVIAWSDTRFHTGHQFYRRKGFRQLDETRFLNDLSDTQEFCFEKDL